MKSKNIFGAWTHYVWFVCVLYHIKFSDFQFMIVFNIFQHRDCVPLYELKIKEFPHQYYQVNSVRCRFSKGVLVSYYYILDPDVQQIHWFTLILGHPISVHLHWNVAWYVKIYSSAAFTRNSVFHINFLLFAVALYACAIFINWILHKWFSHIRCLFANTTTTLFACTCMSICHAIYIWKATRKKWIDKHALIYEWNVKRANELQ